MYCHGVGTFVDTPKLKTFNDTEDNNITKKVSYFELSFTRSINNRKEYNILPFEIWGTAAEYIVTNFKKGDKINILDSIARSNSCQEKTIIFRINDFSKSE